MGVPTSEVGYTSATTRRGDHEVYKRHVVALKKKSHNTFKLNYTVTVKFQCTNDFGTNFSVTNSTFEFNYSETDQSTSPVAAIKKVWSWEANLYSFIHIKNGIRH
jgi:hypothetical protein